MGKFLLEFQALSFGYNISWLKRDDSLYCPISYWKRHNKISWYDCRFVYVTIYFTRFCLIYCQICNCAHIYLLRFLFLTSFLEVETFCAMEFTSNYYVIFKFWVWEFDSCTEIFFPFILIIDLLGSMSVTLQSALYVTDIFMFTFISLLVFFELAKYVKLFYFPIFNWLNILLLFFPVCVCMCVCITLMWHISKQVWDSPHYLPTAEVIAKAAIKRNYLMVILEIFTLEDRYMA